MIHSLQGVQARACLFKVYVFLLSSTVNLLFDCRLPFPLHKRKLLPQQLLLLRHKQDVMP